MQNTPFIDATRPAARAAATLLVTAAALAVPFSGRAAAQDPDARPLGALAPAAAPAGGPLLIVGGGRQPDALVTRFVELAGGPGAARIAVIPLAGSAESGESKAEQFRELGAESFVLLTTAGEARGPAVRARLEQATGVWFTGGDQSRITAAMDGTPLLDALRARNRAGVVVGGTSAGAAILSPLMLTGSQVLPGEDTVGYHGDTFARIARNTIELVPGFGLLPGVIVDQHFVRRERHNRLLSVVLEHPDHIGVGIDESTALEVTPTGEWRVHGESVVMVYDARGATVTDPASPVLGAAGLRVHVLPPGSAFDPRTGSVRLGSTPMQGSRHEEPRG